MKSNIRTYRTPRQWQSILTDFESSGLSRASFCHQRQIGYNSFCRWYARLHSGEPEPVTQGVEPTVRFTPLLLDEPEQAAERPTRFRLDFQWGRWLQLQLSAGA